MKSNPILRDEVATQATQALIDGDTQVYRDTLRSTGDNSAADRADLLSRVHVKLKEADADK